MDQSQQPFQYIRSQTDELYTIIANSFSSCSIYIPSYMSSCYVSLSSLIKLVYSNYIQIRIISVQLQCSMTYL